MAVARRIYEFPGGFLEANAYGDDPEDDSGVHLELFTPSGQDDESQTAVMRWKPTCIGYLRTDVSGMAQLWDQTQIRRLATRLGYDFSDMVVYDPKFGRPPLARLKAQATRLDAEAVIVPSPAHFENHEIPRALVRQVDVITVSPEETYARRGTPPQRDRPPANAEKP
ncbi:hypothetical protein [Nocardia jejuensis]|uniref:hypothetical protein n=1 Tax=Nocardia jejuensis TaxID=328049 RepID=UPI000A8A2AF7|nr:hypothetical protein [Nocardia jejuensis]